MWIDKQLYWASTEKGDGDPPTEKKIVYADIFYPHSTMKIAIGYYDDDVYSHYEEGIKEVLWHLTWGAKTSCLNKCKLEPYQQYCLGCKLTMEDIRDHGKNRSNK